MPNFGMRARPLPGILKNVAGEYEFSQFVAAECMEMFTGTPEQRAANVRNPAPVPPQGMARARNEGNLIRVAREERVCQSKCDVSA